VTVNLHVPASSLVSCQNTLLNLRCQGECVPRCSVANTWCRLWNESPTRHDCAFDSHYLSFFVVRPTTWYFQGRNQTYWQWGDNISICPSECVRPLTPRCFTCILHLHSTHTFVVVNEVHTIPIQSILCTFMPLRVTKRICVLLRPYAA